MRELKVIEAEIEELRKELNLASQNRLPSRIPSDEILTLSKKMDELINEYHSEYYTF